MNLAALVGSRARDEDVVMPPAPSRVPHQSRRHGERGQASVELGGLLVIVAMIFAALAMTGLSQTFTAAVGRAVGTVLDGGGSPPQAGTAPGSTAPGSTGGPGASAPGSTGGPGSAASGSTAGSGAPPPVFHVAPLTKDNELKPWTRIGLTEKQWDQLQSEILSKVNPHGFWASLIGPPGYFGINLDKNGHLVLIPIEEDGIGEGLGELLDAVGVGGRALAATVAEALTQVVAKLPLPVLSKLAAYGVLPTTTEASEDFATATDQAFFWSGRTAGVSVQTVARELAEGRGGTTLEALMDQRGIRLPEWDPNDPASIEAWTNASRSYAQGASGTVYAVLGSSTRAGSVWETVELPALEGNTAVTRIVGIDPATHAETVIFQR
jgi:hypothetical protein